MGISINIIGEKFGRLKVIERDYSDKKNSKWFCLCECGNKLSVYYMNMKNGATTSCGCFNKECVIKRSTTHGVTSNGKRSSEYNSWSSMIQRCTNEKSKYYKNYGGRGIKVCEEWQNSFEKFLIDMGYRPKNTSIDRIDNEKGYFKENCKWSTAYEQSNNTRRNRLFLVEGVYLNMKQVCNHFGLPLSTVYTRISRKFTIDRLFIPKLK